MFFELGCQPRAKTSISAAPTPNVSVTVLGQREYDVHQKLTLANKGPGEPEKQNIWVALFQTFSPYQEVQSMQVSPEGHPTITDEYGNHDAEFDFSGQSAGTTKTAQIAYRVTVYELSYGLTDCQGAPRTDFAQSELYIESANPQIVALAGQLSQGKSTVCQQVRAFSDYISSTLVYTYNGQNWGPSNSGPMGSDCTE
ncbi:MAG: hypothetical protein WCA79_16415 [Anaerolineales bacterium]